MLRVQALKVHKGLPLQGFLNCATCQRQHTGSASKGRNGFYYQAQHSYGCICRYKADLLNEDIIKELQKFVYIPGMTELYQLVITDINKAHKNQPVTSVRRSRIRSLNFKAGWPTQGKWFFEEKLAVEDHNLMKKEC